MFPAQQWRGKRRKVLDDTDVDLKWRIERARQRIKAKNKITSFFFTLVLLPNLKDTAPWVHRPCREKHTGIHCFKVFCYLLMPENWKHKSDGLICDTVVCNWRGFFSASEDVLPCSLLTGNGHRHTDLSRTIKVRVSDESINDSVMCHVLLMTSLHSKTTAERFMGIISGQTTSSEDFCLWCSG